MSDIYVRDTLKKMNKFKEHFEGIEFYLNTKFQEAYTEFTLEVEYLIDQYKELLDRVEELETTIEDLS